EDQLDDVADWIKISPLGLPISTAAITRAVKNAEPTREFFVRKLRQILRRPLQHGGAFVRVAGRDGRLVKLRLPSVVEHSDYGSCTRTPLCSTVTDPASSFPVDFQTIVTLFPLELLRSGVQPSGDAYLDSNFRISV